MLSFKRFFKSFAHAWRGLMTAFREEQSFRIQILAAVVAAALAVYFRVKPWEIIVLILVAVFTLVLELLNSVIERLVDAMRPRIHLTVAVIKDITAAAVLISSLGALAVGIIIFYPHVKALVIK